MRECRGCLISCVLHQSCSVQMNRRKNEVKENQTPSVSRNTHAGDRQADRDGSVDSGDKDTGCLQVLTDARPGGAELQVESLSP